MKRTIGRTGLFPVAILIVSTLGPITSAWASANHLVISEIQTRGDGGIPADDEFIEIHNPTASATSIAGWSIQYRSSTGNFLKQNISAGLVQPFGYFLVARSAYNGAVLPDLVNNQFLLSAASGSVFLVSNQVLLGACASGAIVDQVAYGAGSNQCPEGAPVAAPPSNGSFERLPGASDPSCGNGTDTDSNSSDFQIRPLSEPQNASSPPEACGADADGDGILDANDNCAGTYNPDQTDSDLDGMGDSCDCAPFDFGASIPGPVASFAHVSHDRSSGLTTLDWSPIPAGSHYNTYRGTIPVGMMASRGGGAYDHACFERGDVAANGETVSRDAAAPPPFTAFYYLVDGIGGCGEGSLGQASSGAPRPNSSPCVTPPPPPGSIRGTILGDVVDAHGVSLALIPLPGLVVDLFRGSHPVTSTSTDAAGYYFFPGLTQGVYDVRGIAPDSRTTRITTPVTDGTNVTVNFLVVPRKPEGIFGGYAGLAVGPTTPGDLDGSGLVDLGDITRVVAQFGLDPSDADGDLNGDGQIDGADVVQVTNAFGRAVLLVPGTYQVQVTHGGTLVNVDSGSTIVRSIGGFTDALMSFAGPSQVAFQVTQYSGTLSSPELGTFNYQENPADPTVMTIDLDTNRVLGGHFSVRLIGGVFSSPVDVVAPIPDGFVTLAPGGFGLHHLVGIQGSLPPSFPIYANAQFVLGKCDPPKANVDCATRVAVAGDQGKDTFGRVHDCVRGIDDVCTTPGAACATAGFCGTCTIFATRGLGGWSCDCRCVLN